MNEETFARLLQEREGETLDFKQELPGSSDLAVLISAFCAEMRQLYLLSGEVSYETLPCRASTLADLSQALLARYRERRNRHTAGALDLSDEELLRNLGCVVEEEGRLLPTNAGVLLFCEDPFRFLRQNEITCAQFKGTDMMRTIDRKDLRGPLPDLVVAAEQFLYRHIRIGHEVIGFEGIDYWEYPREAMREALINAVIHRDYSITGGRIRIFMFDDRIEFYSPGDLLPGISVEKMQRLESQSKLRNPFIVEVFRDLGGFIEKMGTGIQRIARVMEEHGLPIPRFEELGGEFRVTLTGPGDLFMAGQPLPKWMQDLNKRQVQALQLVRRQGRITRREYEKLAGISRTVAKQDLQALVERGLLVRHVAGPRTYYVAHEIGSSSSSSAADRRPRNGR